jgi:hypothetical protein
MMMVKDLTPQNCRTNGAFGSIIGCLYPWLFRKRPECRFELEPLGTSPGRFVQWHFAFGAKADGFVQHLCQILPQWLKLFA